MALLLLTGSALAVGLPAHGSSPLAAMLPQQEQIRKLADSGSLEGLMPMLSQMWTERNPGKQFPLQAAQGLPFPMMAFSAAVPAAAQPAAKPAPAAAPAAAAPAAKPEEKSTTPATDDITKKAIEDAAKAQIKCQVPTKNSFCTGVTWPVPYSGWTEWEIYVEDSLRYYMDYIYDDADDDGRNTTIKISDECKTAMKSIGCSFYFPKCDHADLPLPPCKGLCSKWKKDLACPGSDTYSCTASNGFSVAFAGQGKCTEYSEGGKSSASASQATAHLVNLVADTSVPDTKESAPAQAPVAQAHAPVAQKRKSPDQEAEEETS